MSKLKFITEKVELSWDTILHHDLSYIADSKLVRGVYADWEVDSFDLRDVLYALAYRELVNRYTGASLTYMLPAEEKISMLITTYANVVVIECGFVVVEEEEKDE